MSDKDRNYQTYLEIDAENRQIHSRNYDKHHYLYLTLLIILLLLIGVGKFVSYEVPISVGICLFASLILYVIAYPLARHAVERRREFNKYYYLEEKEEYGVKDPWSQKVTIFLEYISDGLLLASLFGFIFG